MNLLDLPPEIREEIYRIILRPDANRVFGRDDYNDYNYAGAFALFKLNHQILRESRRVFRHLNIFVRISTPWPEAQRHVFDEGHVPILFMGQRADDFDQHSMDVVLGAPEMQMHHFTPQRFVILLDDLPKFTRFWFYSDLTNPRLNSFLDLKLHLRDPYTPEWEGKHISKAVQRRLLLPFGEIKGLSEMTITGHPKPLASIEEELRSQQADPAPTPEQCLDDADRLKSEGNAKLMGGDPAAALELYQEAWEAMHIIVRGRARHIHAEQFFARNLEREPWQDKDGRFERLILRVHLVANTCQAYLKLEKWEEVEFWGTRTINMMRRGTLGPMEEAWDVPPEHEAITGFEAGPQMGKIYYRTAVALRHMDNKAEARRLLRVAELYLPQDQQVKREIAECRLRLG